VVLINYGSTGDSVSSACPEPRPSPLETVADIGYRGARPARALGVSASSATVALPAQSITTVYGR